MHLWSVAEGKKSLNGASLETASGCRLIVAPCDIASERLFESPSSSKDTLNSRAFHVSFDEKTKRKTISYLPSKDSDSLALLIALEE